MTPRDFWRVTDDYAPGMGAALSYYMLFSTAPLLVIAIAGFFFGPDAFATARSRSASARETTGLTQDVRERAVRISGEFH